MLLITWIRTQKRDYSIINIEQSLSQCSLISSLRGTLLYVNLNAGCSHANTAALLILATTFSFLDVRGNI